MLWSFELSSTILILNIQDIIHNVDNRQANFALTNALAACGNNRRSGRRLSHLPDRVCQNSSQLASNAAASASNATSSSKPKNVPGSVRYISYGALPAHKLNIAAAEAPASSVVTPRAGASAMQIVRDTWKAHGVTGFFRGAGAMVTGNSAKAGVRFLTYDTIQNLLRPKTTATSGSKEKLDMGRSILAGFLAGSAEAMLAVTPSEAVKTRMIQTRCNLLTSASSKDPSTLFRRSSLRKAWLVSIAVSERQCFAKVPTLLCV